MVIEIKFNLRNLEREQARECGEREQKYAFVSQLFSYRESIQWKELGMIRHAGNQVEFKSRTGTFQKARYKLQCRGARSSPRANKSSKDAGNDFGNAPISNGESREPTRSGELLCSLFCRNEAGALSSRPRVNDRYNLIVAFIYRNTLTCEKTRPKRQRVYP